MDLSTVYMGLTLEHPIIASASPMSGNLDTMVRLEDAGASAIVVSSLFEEQIRLDGEIFSGLMELGTNSYAEALNYFNEIDTCHVNGEDYLRLIRRAAEKVNLPIIASLNCVTFEGWVEYAKQIECAGAAGIELNIYSIESSLDVLGTEVEQGYLDILYAVKSSVNIPVAVKLSPMFSAMGNMAKRLDRAGADALVLFNRFYQPDIDVQSLQASPYFGLTPAGEVRLPLMWIALLHGKIKASLAATRGVEEAEDVIKYILAGADVVMTASALMRNGPEHIATLLDGFKQWMDARGFTSVREFRGGMSHGNVSNPEVFHHVNCARVLASQQGVPAWT